MLIGEWRGVGQPRRNSSKDAWTEQSDWVWDLQQDQPALVQTVTNSQLAETSRLEFDPAAGQYLLTVATPTSERQQYRGTWTDDQLVLVAQGSETSPSRRITLTLRSDIRVTALHEVTEPGRDVYFRVAEIGYTRQGRRLAIPGGGQPQCIVTGGLGTIEVSYKGETYYVCCTGCKQAFDADPERILKEYRQRLQQERAAKP